MNSIIKFIITVFLFFILFNCKFNSKPEFKTLIRSQPHNAKVFVQEEYLGNTPLFYKFTTKEKKIIKLIKKDYYPYEQTIFFSNNIDYLLKLIPKKKNFSIYFSPKPDKVFINQNQKTIHPIENNKGKVNLHIPNGEYQVIAIKKNLPFFNYRFKLTDKSPKNIRLFLNNPNHKNKLIIKSPVKNVSIYYQGAKIDETPQTYINLDKKTIRLSFHKKNYETKKIQFSLGKKEIRAVKIRLALLDSTFPVRFSNLPPNHQISVNHKLAIPVNKNVLVEYSTNHTYNYRVDALGYYSVIKNFIYTNQKNDSMIKPFLIPLKMLKKTTPKFIKKTKLSTSILTARFFQNNLFITDNKNQLLKYNQNLDLIYTYFFSTIKTEDSPKIDFGFNELGIFLLSSGLISQHKFLTGKSILGKSFFNQPSYLLDNKNYILVFNNGSHKIKVWQKGKQNQVNSHKVIKTITGYDYFEEEFIYKLRFGQATWFDNTNDTKEQFLFTDPLNGNLKVYNLNRNLGSPFLLLEDRPLQPRSLSLYRDLLFIGENQQIWVYLKNGELQDKYLFFEFSKNIRFSFISHNKLYLITEQEILLYQF